MKIFKKIKERLIKIWTAIKTCHGRLWTKIKIDRLYRKELKKNRIKIAENNKKIAENEKSIKELLESWPQKARKFYTIFREAEEIYHNKFTWKEKNTWLTGHYSGKLSIIEELSYHGFTVDYEKDEDPCKNVKNFMKAFQNKANKVCCKLEIKNI